VSRNARKARLLRSSITTRARSTDCRRSSWRNPGIAGTFTLVKAERIEAARVDAAAIRHNPSLGIRYTARVAWAAIGKRTR
jgi:hypothetical protein